MEKNRIINEKCKSNHLILVLGSGYDSKTLEPKEELRIRLDQCIKLYQDSCRPKILLSGGNISKYLHTEASVMKMYLIKNEVPIDDIFIEPYSMNTIENIIFSLDVIHNNPKLGKIEHITVISSTYHLPRISTIIERLIFYSYSTPPIQYLFRKFTWGYLGTICPENTRANREKKEADINVQKYQALILQYSQQWPMNLDELIKRHYRIKNVCTSAKFSTHELRFSEFRYTFTVN
jgi:uncharacterized SAM-binding protein YcdF (DUF218 family)